MTQLFRALDAKNDGSLDKRDLDVLDFSRHPPPAAQPAAQPAVQASCDVFGWFSAGFPSIPNSQLRSQLQRGSRGSRHPDAYGKDPRELKARILQRLGGKGTEVSRDASALRSSLRCSRFPEAESEDGSRGNDHPSSFRS